MNKYLSLFVAALIGLSALSGPVFAAQSGDHIKQHDPVYWNPSMRDNDTMGRMSGSELRKERPAAGTTSTFQPN
jgi:hypothetical protein